VRSEVVKKECSIDLSEYQAMNKTTEEIAMKSFYYSWGQYTKGAENKEGQHNTLHNKNTCLGL